MTSETLFRGKRTTGSGFVYGSLVVDKAKSKSFISSNHVYQNDIDVTVTNVYEVDPATVGQYTGKKCTATGDRMFTHDIVKDYRGDTFHVVYDAHYAAFMLRSSLTYAGSKRMEGSYEKVGNIFDDPFVEPEPQGREQPPKTRSSESFTRRNQKEAMKGLTNKK